MYDVIEELLGQMTLQEKVSLLAGSDYWHTTPIKRLGIPALKMTDGPSGARGGGSPVHGVKTACFPVGIALASTWNTELVEQVGQALGHEAKLKGARVLLAPTVNIHRSPLGGRNFECYSEDPFLSSKIAVACICGIQSQGVGAAVKHYVCNDSEFERTTLSSEVGERALREIYLPPFRAAVREAHSWALMVAYNLVNGIAVSEHLYLLTKILLEEWEFDGLVMSDWFFSVKSTAASMNAGLDLEMPGPPLWRGEKLLQAVEHGEVQETTLDTSIRRLLRLLNRVGLFEDTAQGLEQAIDLPTHRAIARASASEGIVLLKNEFQVLPLSHESLRSMAIIGPNAKTAQIMAGGSAQVNAHYAITPFDGIMTKVGKQTTVSYELGCTNRRLLPVLDVDLVLAGNEGTERGVSVEYFNSPGLSGMSDWRGKNLFMEVQWLVNDTPFPGNVNPQQYSFRWTGRFVPRETGHYTFGLVSVGLSRLFIAGHQVIDNWTQQTPGELYYGVGTAEVTATVEMVVGRIYPLTLEYSINDAQTIMSAVRLGCLPPMPSDAIERAVAAAAASDVALVFVGMSGEWESEGYDRPNMDLPGMQDALVAQVAAVNPRTIVVLNTGSPITMPWLDQVSAVVQAWYPGQECGNAIADVLFGDINPSGKLPQTFPVRLEDTPAYLNFPGENGKVHYGEGLFVGYRYYEKKHIAPLFPFGFGLSYTTFAYSSLSLSAQDIGPDDTLHVSVDITNTGQRAGKEIVQVYVRAQHARLLRPEKELKAFAKIPLDPGESKKVMLSLERDALAYYDDLAHQWVAEAGTFEVLVGASSQDIRATALFTLIATCRWPS